MTEPNFRALCAELLSAMDTLYRQSVTTPYSQTIEIDGIRHAIPIGRDILAQDAVYADLMDRARAALAQSEPQGASDQELLRIYRVATPCYQVEEYKRELDFARAVLARWGRPTIEPVPVAERLPGSEDCDAEGRCWWWIVDQPGELPHWIYCTLEKLSWTNFTHSLPHYALPVPTPNNSTKQED